MYQAEYRKKHPNYQREYRLRGADYVKKYKLKSPNYAREYYKKYYIKNFEKLKKYSKEYREKTNYPQKYCELNKKKLRLYYRAKRETDIQYRLAQNIRARFHLALKGKVKLRSSIHWLGCTIPQFRDYIERQFKEGMSWENYGLKTWHIDHKIPLTFFDLTDEAQLRKACHFSNLQPMWAKENIRKGKKLVSV